MKELFKFVKKVKPLIIKPIDNLRYLLTKQIKCNHTLNIKNK